ncbi:MAG TPA: hypothetical protein VGM82_16765 [Gemmatimonadaceae bacterium]
MKPDGAITVYAGGSYVEPYFAMRALNTAADLGANVDRLARDYINWQLARLDADSAFRRYCLKDASWSACGPADADDAALALWIELLYRTAGRDEILARCKSSADASRLALAGLKDSTGAYLVSRSLRTSLFMDNIEVLSAFDVAAATPAAAAAGDNSTLRVDADRLRLAISQVFWNPATHTYRVSTQPGSAIARFYPEMVAQIYPAMFGYGTPERSSESLVAQWLADHGRDWAAESDTSAAWGLVAMAAMRAGRTSTATCWLGRAIKVRPTARWNVADESIYRALADRLSIRDTAVACRADLH